MQKKMKKFCFWLLCLAEFAAALVYYVRDVKDFALVFFFLAVGLLIRLA